MIYLISMTLLFKCGTLFIDSQNNLHLIKIHLHMSPTNGFVIVPYLHRNLTED